jgi:hypothetical protein
MMPPVRICAGVQSKPYPYRDIVNPMRSMALLTTLDQAWIARPERTLPDALPGPQMKQGRPLGAACGRMTIDLWIASRRRLGTGWQLCSETLRRFIRGDFDQEGKSR